MIDFSHTLLQFWPVLALAVLLAGISLAAPLFFGKEEEEKHTPFEKKLFVFDAMSELTLYRQLIGLFGDKYYIFPQVPYARLVKVKKGKESYNRNRFDKKIADFVLCDKDRAVAKLVIELDGTSHQTQKKIERDNKVDFIMQQIGLPILHLKTGSFDNEKLKIAVSEKLSVVQLNLHN